MINSIILFHFFITFIIIFNQEQSVKYYSTKEGPAFCVHFKLLDETFPLPRFIIMDIETTKNQKNEVQRPYGGNGHGSPNNQQYALFLTDYCNFNFAFTNGQGSNGEEIVVKIRLNQLKNDLTSTIDAFSFSFEFPIEKNKNLWISSHADQLKMRILLRQGGEHYPQDVRISSSIFEQDTLPDPSKTALCLVSKMRNRREVLHLDGIPPKIYDLLSRISSLMIIINWERTEEFVSFFCKETVINPSFRYRFMHNGAKANDIMEWHMKSFRNEYITFKFKMDEDQLTWRKISEDGYDWPEFSRVESEKDVTQKNTPIYVGEFRSEYFECSPDSYVKKDTRLDDESVEYLSAISRTRVVSEAPVLVAQPIKLQKAQEMVKDSSICHINRNVYLYYWMNDI